MLYIHSKKGAHDSILCVFKVGVNITSEERMPMTKDVVMTVETNIGTWEIVCATVQMLPLLYME